MKGEIINPNEKLLQNNLCKIYKRIFSEIKARITLSLETSKKIYFHMLTKWLDRKQRLVMLRGLNITIKH